MLGGLKDVDSVIMAKNADFTASQKGPAPFLITPDLPIKFYYGTMEDKSGLHDFLPDDTWKLVSCRP